MPTPVIAIFDIGKTNKKIFLLDDQYSIQWESSVKFDEILDEDGFLCDDIQVLTKWVKDTFAYVTGMTDFEITCIRIIRKYYFKKK